MSNKKVVLITGNAGFIGSHIADNFIKHKYLVLGIDNLKNGSKENIHPLVKFFQVDLNKIQIVEEIFKKYNPYFLIHNAANIVDVSQSVKYPHQAYKDALMTIKLLEKAKKYEVGHIIFPSSASVYGNQTKQSITEDFVIKPLSPYGLTKVTGEKFLDYFSHAYKVPVCIFRYFNVYGSRQSLQYSPVIPIFITRLLSNKTIHLYGGNQTRDFVHVSDVAKANRVAAEKRIEGIYNVGSGKQIDIKQIITLLEKITHKKAKLKYFPKKIAECDFSEASIKKIKQFLNWNPEMGFEEGLRQTIDYYSQHNNLKIINRNTPASYPSNP